MLSTIRNNCIIKNKTGSATIPCREPADRIRLTAEIGPKGPRAWMPKFPRVRGALLAGDREAAAAAQANAQPAPAQGPAPAVPAQTRDEPVAVRAHHDQPREVNVDLPEQGHEFGMLVLVLHTPDGLCW